MQKTIAAIGSAEKAFTAKESAAARQVGAEVARQGCMLLTGACLGLPLEAARGARAEGGTVVGVSPADGASEHGKKYGYPFEPFDFIAYTGFGYKGRNVVLVRSAGAVIALKGGMGTLNELTIAYDEGKVIGVLTGMRGVSEMLPQILKRIARRTKAVVVADSSPRKLVRKVVLALKNHAEVGEDEARK